MPESFYIPDALQNIYREGDIPDKHQDELFALLEDRAAFYRGTNPAKSTAPSLRKLKKMVGVLMQGLNEFKNDPGSDLAWLEGAANEKPRQEGEPDHANLGHTRINAAINEVAKLAQWTARARELRPKGGGRPRNWKLYAWASPLFEFWTLTLGRNITIRKDEGLELQKRGSFPAFLSASIEPLNPNATDEIMTVARQFQDALRA